MRAQATINFATEFEEEVYKGLKNSPKQLSSKYFYDKKGDRLFQDIMNMPEYYLTDAEFEILQRYRETLTTIFTRTGDSFDLIELGAGDGKKTKVLLDHLSNTGKTFKYWPIDISQNILEKLEQSLRRELPNVHVELAQGTYFEALKNSNFDPSTRKVILFLGSNIGNFRHQQAITFLTRLQELMGEDDLLLVGFDQKKNPRTILDAYNDPTGITEAFNKNILRRINTEMDGDFDLDQFLHWPVYNAATGMALSYLVSKKKQTVRLQKLNMHVHFQAWESIHTEISQKYDDTIVSWLAERSGLAITHQFSDTKNYYKNYIFKKNPYESDLEQ